MREYTGLARVDPHVVFYVLLPPLIFESAFAMDVHTFRKSTTQILVLAGPGMVLSTVMLAIMARFIFSYGWSWSTCMLFGSILRSALGGEEARAGEEGEEEKEPKNTTVARL